MKITLDHEEIDQALIDFVRKQGLDVKAGDIQIKVQDGQISASLATTFLTSIDPATPVAVAPKSSCCKAPVVETHEEEPDREVLKAKLDKLGIEYAPKARTATLQSLVDEASGQQEFNFDAAKTEDTSDSIFGQAEPPIEAAAEESPPFDTDTKPVEEPDDDKPLFGAQAMKAIRDVVIALVIVVGLLGALLALPFIVFLLTLLGVGFIVYAIIHDSRLATKEEESTIHDKDANDRDSSK